MPDDEVGGAIQPSNFQIKISPALLSLIRSPSVTGFPSQQTSFRNFACLPEPRVRASVASLWAHMTGSLTVSLMRSAASWLLRQSQRPSLARIRHVSSGSSCECTTSGSAVSPALFRSASPIALHRPCRWVLISICRHLHVKPITKHTLPADLDASLAKPPSGLGPKQLAASCLDPLSFTRQLEGVLRIQLNSLAGSTKHSPAVSCMQQKLNRRVQSRYTSTGGIMCQPAN